MDTNKILYKYRVDYEFTEKIFTEHKVWLSNAAGLNDAFECTIQDIASELIKKATLEQKKSQLAGFYTSAIFSIKRQSLFFGLKPKETKHLLKQMGKKPFDKQYVIMRQIIKTDSGTSISTPGEIFKSFDRQLQEIGIFSMAERADNELMWSHYADSNKGIAIGFRAEEGSKLLDDEHCLKVVYSDEMPKVESDNFLTTLSMTIGGQNIQRLQLKDENLRAAISNKSTNWEYEQEWRYIEETSGAFDYPGELCQVVFGLNCPQEVREKYIRLAHENISNEVFFFEIQRVQNSKSLALVPLIL